MTYFTTKNYLSIMMWHKKEASVKAFSSSSGINWILDLHSNRNCYYFHRSSNKWEIQQLLLQKTRRAHGNTRSVVSLQVRAYTSAQAPDHPTPPHPGLVPASSPKQSKHFSPGRRRLSNSVPPRSTDTTGSSHGARQAQYSSTHQRQCRWSSQIQAGQALSPDTSV